MNINWLAVLVAAIASMVIGSIWYGPLFGKSYMSLMGMDKLSPEEKAKMKKGMIGMYIVQLIASFVSFYVLARFINGLGNLTALGGLHTALWVWIGFLVPTQLGNALWGGKMKLFWLSAGGSLLTAIAAGLIIGAWG